MHFQLSEEHLMIQKAARDFARTECLPGVIERDEHQKFPKEQILKLAELGFMGMMVDPAYGGAGMDTVSYVLAMEEISKIDASVSVCMSVNNSLVCWGLDQFGTDSQKQKYLTPLAQGRKDGELYIGAFPAQRARGRQRCHLPAYDGRRQRRSLCLNGVKNWITNGNSASVYLVIAQTDVPKAVMGSMFHRGKEFSRHRCRPEGEQIRHPGQRHPQYIFQ
jgi:alkylation response protein AidB-like acyl-CoA dehydrogenase